MEECDLFGVSQSEEKEINASNVNGWKEKESF